MAPLRLPLLLLASGALGQGPPVPESELPPGLRAWIGRDFCGTAPWVDFYGGLSEVVRLFNSLDFSAALAAAAELLRPVLQDPHSAFSCGTAVASTLILSAQCCEQLQLPILGTRFRQLAALFSAYDYQMKGEDYIDRSPWPMTWAESMEGILRSMTFFKEQERQLEPARAVPLRAALGTEGAGSVPKLRLAIISVCDYDPKKTPLAHLSELNKKSYAERYGYDVEIHAKAPVFRDALGAGLLTEPMAHRPPAWSKVDALLEAMATGEHDWLMWMDCDSFFMDQSVALADVVASAAQGDAIDARDLQQLRELVRQWRQGPMGGEPLQEWYDDLLLSAAGERAAPPANFPRNRTLGFDSWLSEERRLHVIASEDGLMLNTGIMLVRSSVWSWHWLQKVRAMTFGQSPVTQHPWWEQTAMVYLLQLPFTLARAAEQPQRDVGLASQDRGHAPASLFLAQRHINSYPPLVASALRTHEAFEAGDFIISFSGCKVYSSQEVCNQLFLGYFFQVHDVVAHQADPVLRSWL